MEQQNSNASLKQEQQQYFKRLQAIHISQAVDNSLKEIDDRRKGINTGLKTRWTKLNKVIGGGIQWGANYTLAGISGSGKSSIGNMLETDLFDFNPNEKFIVLNFNFEMASHKQITRKFSALTERTVYELNSVHGSIQDSEYTKLKLVGEKLKKYKIFYFDIPANTNEIYDTVMYYQSKYPDHRILNMYDHTRLLKRDKEKDEYEVVTNLTKVGIELKKKINCSNIYLSQLNREIENEKRLSNPNLHYPMRSDLFGADALYQGSDFVFVAHRPAMLQLQYYGPNNIPTQDLVAFHILKNRDGESGLIRMKDILKYNTIEEM